MNRAQFATSWQLVSVPSGMYDDFGCIPAGTNEALRRGILYKFEAVSIPLLHVGLLLNSVVVVRASEALAIALTASSLLLSQHPF